MNAFALAVVLSFGATADGEVVTAVAGDDGLCRFAYERRIDGWGKDAYVLLPAAAYDGNRAFRRIPAEAPDYGAWYRPEDFGSGRCPWTLIDKVPALAADNSGVLEGSAGDLAFPCAAFYLPGERKGVVCWFEPQLKGRDAGFRFENGLLRIEYPARRKELLFKASDAVDPAIACKLGEKVSVRYRFDEFPCDSVAGLYAGLFKRRTSFISSPRAPLPGVAERRRLANLVAKRMADDSVRLEPDRGTTWASGWCGGPVNLAALANVGYPGAREFAAAALDFMAATQEDSGLFRGISCEGNVRLERVTHPDSKGLLLTRRSADGLFWAVRILDFAGATPEREKSLRTCADAIIRIFDACGELPQYVDRRTGANRIAGSTSAAMAPAALVRMARRFREPRYLDGAERIAEQMWTTYVSRGLSFGGPGDAGDACDSESIYAFLESCVALAEAGRNAKAWIPRAETAAHILSTWIVPYRYEFPPDSEFGRRGVNTVGSVIANLQNRHAAPGFCTASGDALARLAKLTGNAAYRELYLDVVSFFPQVVSTPERPITARLWTDRPRVLDPGAINERVNMSGWEGLKGVGEVFPGPCWSELSFLLIPGLVDEELKL